MGVSGYELLSEKGCGCSRLFSPSLFSSHLRCGTKPDPSSQPYTINSPHSSRSLVPSGRLQLPLPISTLLQCLSYITQSTVSSRCHIHPKPRYPPQNSRPRKSPNPGLRPQILSSDTPPNCLPPLSGTQSRPRLGSKPHSFPLPPS